MLTRSLFASWISISHVEENIPYEHHVFCQLSAQERHCNFGTSLSNNLRDQLIKKLLEQKTVGTKEEALDKARACEAAGRQATNMTVNQVVMEEDSVDAVKTRQEKGDDKPRKCYSCGREGHLAIDNNCPGKVKKCAKCGRYGQFALCSLGKSDNYATGGKPEQGRGGSGRQQSYIDNFVGDQRASSSEGNCAFAFAVTENSEETCNAICLQEPVLEVNVNGITARVLIDSGSVSNLTGIEEFGELKSSLL